MRKERPSFGNRFFVSLTPLFILGLSVFLERASTLFRSQRAAVAAASVVLAAFMFWNAEFMFQWGAHLIPPRGPISWSTRVVALLDSPKCRADIGSAARRKVAQRHDVNQAAPRIMEIIERTIKRP